jgi:hypothetical protein
MYNTTTFSMPDTSYLTSMMHNASSNAKVWLSSSTYTAWVPPPMDPKVDTLPLATFYFLSGAVFFLGTAWMLVSTNKNRYDAIDGIATMSDFTKTSLKREYYGDSSYPYNRELRSILRSNGMDIDELIYRMSGTVKRLRRPVSSP